MKKYTVMADMLDKYGINAFNGARDVIIALSLYGRDCIGIDELTLALESSKFALDLANSNKIDIHKYMDEIEASSRDASYYSQGILNVIRNNENTILVSCFVMACKGDIEAFIANLRAWYICEYLDKEEAVSDFNAYLSKVCAREGYFI